MVAVASDHGGYGLKTHILKYLEDNKIPYKDYGCFDTASVDYPDYALQVAEAVVDGFEVVQIQHEESACTAGAGGEEFIHPQGCGALIEQSGQRIQTGAH